MTSLVFVRSPGLSSSFYYRRFIIIFSGRSAARACCVDVGAAAPACHVLARCSALDRCVRDAPVCSADAGAERKRAKGYAVYGALPIPQEIRRRTR